MQIPVGVPGRVPLEQCPPMVIKRDASLQLSGSNNEYDASCWFLRGADVHRRLADMWSHQRLKSRRYSIKGNLTCHLSGYVFTSIFGLINMKSQNTLILNE
jgi:hypothetical protein